MIKQAGGKKICFHSYGQVGVVLQNLIGFVELDILKVLPIDLQDLQREDIVRGLRMQLLNW